MFDSILPIYFQKKMDFIFFPNAYYRQQKVNNVYLVFIVTGPDALDLVILTSSHLPKTIKETFVS